MMPGLSSFIERHCAVDGCCRCGFSLIFSFGVDVGAVVVVV